MYLEVLYRINGKLVQKNKKYGEFRRITGVKRGEMGTILKANMR